VQRVATIQKALDFVPDPIPEVRASVGQRSIEEIEERVRATMVHEAMRKSKGNVRTAQLLEISRQRLQ
jgi:hypothetical protein